MRSNSRTFSGSKTQKLFRTALLVALGLLPPAVAAAGYKGSLPVRFLSSQEADFFMGSVRNSPDGRQFADVLVVDNTWAWFFAVDANGRQASCTTTDANRIAVARAVNSASYVRLSWNAQGQCTSVQVSNGSYEEIPVR
jgi:hypothetical protein